MLLSKTASFRELIIINFDLSLSSDDDDDLRDRDLVAYIFSFTVFPFFSCLISISDGK
jgi:hypothetical protein